MKFAQIVGTGPSADEIDFTRWESSTKEVRFDPGPHDRISVIGINEAVLHHSNLTHLVVVDERAIQKIAGYLWPELELVLSWQALTWMLSANTDGQTQSEFMRCRIRVRRAVTRATNPGDILAGPGGTLISALDFARREIGADRCMVYGCDFYDPDGTPERNALLGAMAELVRGAIHSGLYEPMKIDWEPHERIPDAVQDGSQAMDPTRGRRR